MHIEDEDAAELKKWIVKKLENISDADSDVGKSKFASVNCSTDSLQVLADYVLALIRAELPESQVRVSAIESLEDFLKDNTTSFVDEVFRAILTKSYIPGYTPSPAVISGGPPFTAPLGPNSAYGNVAVGRVSHEGFPESKKRPYNDRQEVENGPESQYARGGRPMKQMRRGEYDPKNSSLMAVSPTSPTSNGHRAANDQRGNGSARGQGRGRGDRGGFTPRRQNNRADFSQAGPNHDRSITTIVVEQIPEEKFDEGSVRDFFSEFGNILEVTMQPYKRLALVKYDDYMAARGAYESPKVIFDNRFVKVYWYNPDTLPTPSSTAKPLATATTNEPAFDKEEFERNAAAAQKKLEEKKAQMKEMDTKRQALEKQKEELAQKQTEEKRKLLEKLNAKGVKSNDTHMVESRTNVTNEADDSKASAHTRALREKVAELEAEAKSLGLDSALSDYAPRGRGSGR
ncbi:hypothetical protein P7C71_g967, partial [Lecanoromycetidae sp. Uapishka_2]